MKKGIPLDRLRSSLRLLVRKTAAIDGRLFVLAVVVCIGLLFIPIFMIAHRNLHAVTGPAGGSDAPSATTRGVSVTMIHKRINVTQGDTLLGILSEAGVEPKDADALVAALDPLFAPSDLQPGQTISLSLAGEPGVAPPRLDGAQIKVDSTKDIVATFVAPGQFSAHVVPQKVIERPVLVSGTISNSLYDAAEGAGLPLGILMDMIRAYSFDVDFQRDVHAGDSFDVVYERTYDPRGRYLADGDMLFAALTLGGKRSEIYEYRTTRGYTDYFNAAGQSVRKMLMRTPVEGAWISSVFGWRKNPVNGYSEFHRGLDFAVPMNTPIMAAGNGTVVLAGYDSEYGNYVELRHANGYQTLYAHMVAFARGIHAGAVVSQGQVIGYVGTTGMSTGPHLHYEVIYRGERINPATVVSPSGPVLSGPDLEAFLATKVKIDAEYAALKARRPLPRGNGNVARNPDSGITDSQG